MVTSFHSFHLSIVILLIISSLLLTWTSLAHGKYHMMVVVCPASIFSCPWLTKLADAVSETGPDVYLPQFNQMSDQICLTNVPTCSMIPIDDLPSSSVTGVIESTLLYSCAD